MSRHAEFSASTFAVLALAASLACDRPGATPPAPSVVPPPVAPIAPVPVASPKVDPTVAQPTVAQPAPATGDVIAITMQRRAQMVAAGMSPATPILRGTLAEGASQDFQAVMQAGKCFRIIGIGDIGVQDLDLKLFDPNGVQLQQDIATDNYPALGVEAPICPSTAGAYRLQVEMYRGSGAFGVQVYETRG
jgi:hypothetical protein